MPFFPGTLSVTWPKKYYFRDTMAFKDLFNNEKQEQKFEIPFNVHAVST